MIAITVGFRTTSIKSDAVALYVGPDAAEALRSAQSNPPGVAMCHVYKNPAPVKRTFSDGSGAAIEPLIELSEDYKAAVEAANQEFATELESLRAALAEKEAELADLQRLNAELQAALDAAQVSVSQSITNEAGATETITESSETVTDADPAAETITGEGESAAAEQPPLEGLAGALKPKRGK